MTITSPVPPEKSPPAKSFSTWAIATCLASSSRLSPVSPLLGPLFGPLLSEIGRVHRRGVVDEEHGLAAALEPRVDLGLGKGEGKERQHQQLEQEEDVHPQPLKRRVRPQVLKRSLPQQRARDGPRLPPQLQEVEGDEERNRDPGDEDACEWREPGHRRRPRLRR
jgi:hypothetical protein